MANEKYSDDMKHESYGMISFHRCTSNNPVNFFGSSMKHREFIALKISTAKMRKDLSRFWHYEDKTLIEVYISPVQFAELLTCMNTKGTTCTIKRLIEKEMSEPPHENEVQMVDDDFEERVKSVTEELVAGVQESKD